MAQQVQMKQAKKRFKKEEILPLESVNYKIIGGGLALIAAGYVAMSVGPWDGFSAITLSPILLVLGYCVAIPIGIMYRPKRSGAAQSTTAPQVPGSQPPAPVVR